jgi:hypothetical protein
VDGFVHIDLLLPTNGLLTDYRHRAYELPITPLGSFGERVRSRPERGGSCFITARPLDSIQLLQQATYLRALSTICCFTIYCRQFLIHIVKMPIAFPEKGGAADE